MATQVPQLPAAGQHRAVTATGRAIVVRVVQSSERPQRRQRATSVLGVMSMVVSGTWTAEREDLERLDGHHVKSPKPCASLDAGDSRE
ncbi:hypothetical protein CKAH01_14569 [Colletotrichum kahawae]|uniref:Uncharacterized protein n=1 Tax=Colletotrichum kahawae TaxID=34407 RepID=A0AAD9YJZ6_COLKA|nr:hypothetical protein CKAH01_14569 [Colletotrichum kahawae]